MEQLRELQEEVVLLALARYLQQDEAERLETVKRLTEALVWGMPVGELESYKQRLQAAVEGGK